MPFLVNEQAIVQPDSCDTTAREPAAKWHTFQILLTEVHGLSHEGVLLEGLFSVCVCCTGNPWVLSRLKAATGKVPCTSCRVCLEYFGGMTVKGVFREALLPCFHFLWEFALASLIH